MIDRREQRSIVLTPRVVLDKDQRAQYTEGIMPFVLAAREAYSPLKETRGQIKFLDSEQRRIEKQIEESRMPIAGKHPLSAALTGIKISRAELLNSPILPPAREEFRLKANDLIAEVNRWRARFAVLANMVHPRATSLIGQPQIPPAETRNKFTRPDSPVRPHNALGTLSIYRGKEVNPGLAREIQASAPLRTSSIDIADMSLAMVHLIPDHFVSMNRSTPADIRRSGDLAAHIIKLSRTVGEYDAGLLQPPTFKELGTRGVEQNKHITTHLRALLAHFLRDELTNPNRTERQLQDLYQDLSNYVRKTAGHITPRDGHIEESKERIGLIIEGLPGIEGPMLAVRLSTNLFQELGLPCLDYMGENRLAEVMRNIAMSGRKYRDDTGSMIVGGYRVPAIRRRHLDIVMESICGRLDTNEIDCQKLFEDIESLDYGDQVIKNLFEIADDDQKGILLRALTESNCFTDIARNLIEESFSLDDDDDLEE